MKKMKKMKKIGLKIKAKKPELMLVGGIILVAAGVAEAIHAGTKIKDELEPGKEKLDTIHNILENKDEYEMLDETGEEIQEVNEKLLNRELTTVYAKQALIVGKDVLPTIALTTAGILLILGSHKEMSKRYAAMASAFAGISKDFNDYRARVVERFGKDMDRELKYNIKNQEFDKTTIDAKGKEKVTKESVGIVDELAGHSEFSRFFDESSTQWDKSSEYNLMFLNEKQNEMNDKLRANGYVFLNEVYDELGIPRSKAGQYVGWIYDDERGDGYIDFGIFTSKRQVVRDFVNGYENVILLDFNVDGNIIDRLWAQK